MSHNDATDRVRDTLSKYTRKVAGPCQCEDGTCAVCDFYRARVADLTAALAAEYQRGRQEGLEEAARHFHRLAHHEAAAEVCTLATPTPDDVTP